MAEVKRPRLRRRNFCLLSPLLYAEQGTYSSATCAYYERREVLALPRFAVPDCSLPHALASLAALFLSLCDSIYWRLWRRFCVCWVAHLQPSSPRRPLSSRI